MVGHKEFSRTRARDQGKRPGQETRARIRRVSIIVEQVVGESKVKAEPGLDGKGGEGRKCSPRLGDV